jgi:hypothetical protein
MVYFRQSFPLSPAENYEIIGEMMLTGKTEVLGEKKPVLAPFCLPHEEFVVVILIMGQVFLRALQFSTVSIFPLILYVHSATTYPIFQLPPTLYFSK